MSGVLARACEAAERRRAAGLGLTDGQGIFNGDPEALARVFSGFDIDGDELRELTSGASRMFVLMALSGVALHDVFAAAWCDALLVGLLARDQVPDDRAT